jgi:hypothetical protein
MLGWAGSHGSYIQLWKTTAMPAGVTVAQGGTPQHSPQGTTPDPAAMAKAPLLGSSQPFLVDSS